MLLYFVWFQKTKEMLHEGELWIPKDSFLAPLSDQSEPSSFLRMVSERFPKIKVVFCRTSFYNCIGFWVKIITTTKMNRRRYFHRIAWFCFVALMICGCVGKRPDDDVALIKELLAKFERGVNQRSEVVLDSITQGEKENTSSELLDSLYLGRELEGARIASKMFVIIRDSAEVRLKLSLEFAGGRGEPQQREKPLKLFLSKKRGKWGIEDFTMESDEE